jgi:hypothetical protein
MFANGELAMSSDGTSRVVVEVVDLSLAPTDPADTPAPKSDTVPDFTGRAVLVWTRNRPLVSPMILTDCRFERQGGRLFLLGTSRSSRSWLTEWDDGTLRAVAWDAVDDYLVFDSLAAYFARWSPPSSGTN